MPIDAGSWQLQGYAFSQHFVVQYHGGKHATCKVVARTPDVGRAFALDVPQTNGSIQAPLSACAPLNANSDHPIGESLQETMRHTAVLAAALWQCYPFVLERIFLADKASMQRPPWQKTRGLGEALGSGGRQVSDKLFNLPSRFSSLLVGALRPALLALRCYLPAALDLVLRFVCQPALRRWFHWAVVSRNPIEVLGWRPCTLHHEVVAALRGPITRIA